MIMLLHVLCILLLCQAAPYELAGRNGKRWD
jgi:hypothetical protein